MAVTSNIKDITNRIKKHIDANKPVLLTLMSADTIAFSVERFQQQNWKDTTIEPWKARKNYGDNSTRKTLMKSGALWRSIHLASIGSNYFVISSNMKYSKIHNDGGTINVPVTDKMRKFAWAKYYGTKNPFYKNLATTQKQSLSITMPRRRFLGESNYLVQILKKRILTQLLK